MRIHTLDAEMWLPLGIDTVFGFFGDAANLDAITPAWLRFEVLTPAPIPMRPGALIDYRLRVRGLPIRWQSVITRWEPPHLFVDEQVRGPYRRWVHRHEFEPRDGGTVIRDHVEYAVPGWWLEPLVHRYLVGPDLRRIFAHRQQRIRELLAPHAPATEMVVLG